jgi:uncharacterized protein YycO
MLAVMMTAGLLLLAACAGAAPSLGGGEGNAQAVLCQSVAAVRSAAVQLSDINPDTKLSDITAAKANVDKLVDALRAANGVLQRPAINDLLTSYDSFSAQLSAVATQETLGPAVEELRQNLGAVNTALDQAKATLGCQ